MAKTIKFNLILDGHPVRTLEGVQEHFSIEDMLEYFRNGLLERWLNVRGYEKEREAVLNIDPEEDDDEVIKDLVQIFDIPINREDVEKGIEILSYLKVARKLNEKYRENATAKRQMIDDYHNGYRMTVQHMIENKNNMAVLKADVLEIEREYLGLFELNHYELFFMLLERAPQAIFIFLSRDPFRQYWIGEESNSKIFDCIKKNLLPDSSLKTILGDNLKIEKQDTGGNWAHIVPPEIDVMVIKIGGEARVRNPDVYMESLKADDVNEKFLRFRGLDYQCASPLPELIYMEV